MITLILIFSVIHALYIKIKEIKQRNRLETCKEMDNKFWELKTHNKIRSKKVKANIENLTDFNLGQLTY